MDRFGEKMREIRVQRGLTLKELASRLGYASHSHFSEIESGKKQPSVEFVLRLSRAFGVATDELMKDELDLGSLSPQPDGASPK